MVAKAEKRAPISGMKIYIGHDSKQQDATKVCEYSLHKHAKYDIDIDILRMDKLVEDGVYWRTECKASTEFTYSRFLIPHLENYTGWAMFVDSDFVFLKDITPVVEDIIQRPGSERYSCFVVRHAEYTPKNEFKFYGEHQEAVPKKNWSSLILFNCSHPDVKKLSTIAVNNMSPQYLHRFEWTNDIRIGSLDVRWNWLVGEYDINPEPYALHFTNGGPFNQVWGQDNEDIWLQYFQELTGLDYKKLDS